MKWLIGMLTIIVLTGCIGRTDLEGSDMRQEWELVDAFSTEMPITANPLGSLFFPAGQGALFPGSAAISVPPTQKNNLQITDLNPGEYTLQFNVGIGQNSNALPVGSPNPQAYAIIGWKAYGGQQQRIMSIYQGASISGVCDAVDVAIVDQSSLAFGNIPITNPVTLVTYKINATLSRGTRANIQQPPILVTTPAAAALPTGQNTSINIPQNAGVISVLVTATTNAAIISPFSITATQASGGGATLDWYPLQTTTFVPLVPGAEAITVTNNSAQTVNFTFVWGVEG